VDVALATTSELIDLDPDDAPLLEALSREGLSFAAVAWDDPRFDWSQARLCLIRSTWDYHLRLSEFFSWAVKVSERTRLWNPLATIRWNSRKTYLRELSRLGIPVVDTVWLAPGDPADLASIMAGRGWSDSVVKPVVSAGAHRTLHVRRENFEGGQQHLSELLGSGEVMVQPYLESIDDYGERSVIWIDGQVSHGVRKRPILKRSGPDWAEADPADLAPAESELAARAIEAAAVTALYARVDLVRDARGVPRVLELELIEPTLFFSHCSAAASRLARALSRILQGG
jgi:glutathione synthase/RimK-type ligase-like ATP-grasp enzyme